MTRRRTVDDAASAKRAAKALLAERERKIEEQWGPVVGRFNSTRNTGTVYEVRYKPDAVRPLSCNCPGWRFRKTCRHVEYAMDNGLTDPLVGELERPEDEAVDSLLGILKPYLTTRASVPTHVREQVVSWLQRQIRESGGAVPSEASNVPAGVGRMITLED